MPVRLVSALAIGCLLASGTARAQNYTFTNIADTSGNFLSFNTFISLNNYGAVAFLADRYVGGEGIFVGTGAVTNVTTTIVDTVSNPSWLFTGFGVPSINDAGVVAFPGDLNLGFSGIFKGRGIPDEPFAVAASNGPLDGFQIPSINNNGNVAFVAAKDLDGSGIFTGTGALINVTTPIVDTSGNFSSFSSFVSINDNDIVAFTAFLDGGGQGIYKASAGSAVTTIATTAGPFSYFGPPSINNSGTVAFYGMRDTLGSEGIYTSTGAVANETAIIADSSGHFSSFGSYTSINNSGAVAFYGTLNAGGAGIFTGPDPVANKVIKTGDPLFGSTVTLVELSPESLNDSGQIAFRYTLANGVSGIARANFDPVGITVLPTDGLYTTEAGAMDSFTVVLNRRPTADVTIALSSSDTTEGTVSPSSLTFTPANWNVPQTATVTGVSDTVVDGDVAYKIVTAPAVSSDPGYNGLDAADVPVINIDDDTNTNHAPTAEPQMVSLNQDTTRSIKLAGNDADGDTLTFQVKTNPSHGKLTGTAPDMTYTPVSGYAGEDSFTFAVTDPSGETSVATVSITVVDTAPPVISLTGNNPMTVQQGSSFVDPGATAVDNKDGIVSVSVSGVVNTAVPGTYTVTYSAKDSANNPASRTRTVVVTPALVIEQITTKRANGSAQVKFSIRNTGAINAVNVVLTGATLAGVGPNPTLPLSLGSLAPGGSVSVTLTFKVGSGTKPLSISGTSSLGPFSLSQSILVP